MITLTQSIPPSIEYYLGKPDPRVAEWLFLNTPISLVSIISIYFIILKLLDKFMESRKPLGLRKVLIGFNAFQVLYSIHICKEILMSAYLAGYKFSCAPVDTSETPLAMRMANAFWLFYVSKIVDLCNTVFFVLRKKRKQLTFLHLYHHSTMILNWYLGTLYSPGGQAFFSVFCNSFVHVVMYAYYLLSAIGPKMHRYLWWKKYITQLQLTQFILVIAHLLLGLYNRCKAPFWLNWFTITYLCTMVILFTNFYYKAYKMGSRQTNNDEEETAYTKSLYASGDFKDK